MDFIYVVPEEQQEATIDLFCLGGHYKEYRSDPKNPGEMILNDVSKETFALAKMGEVLDQYLLGQNHRKKEEKLQRASMEIITEEDAYSDYLKNKKDK